MFLLFVVLFVVVTVRSSSEIKVAKVTKGYDLDTPHFTSETEIVASLFSEEFSFLVQAKGKESEVSIEEEENKILEDKVNSAYILCEVELAAAYNFIKADLKKALFSFETVTFKAKEAEDSIINAESTLFNDYRKSLKRLRAAAYTAIAIYFEKELVERKFSFNGVDLTDSRGFPIFSAIKDLYIKGSELGNGTAHFRTALFDPIELQQNIVKLYFASVDGNSLAQMALGYRHFTGLGVPKQCSAAVLYYLEAATSAANIIEIRGSELVRDYERLSLGVKDVNGNSNEQDVIDFFSHSADKGDVAAMQRLGQYYFHGIRGAEKDVSTAIEYFTQGAKNKDATCYGMLGNIYLNNLQPEQLEFSKRTEIAKKYFNDAIKTYKKSSTSGNMVGAGIGFNGLGYILLYSSPTNEGLSYEVDKNRVEAFDYFQKAIEHDSVDALYNLANLFLTGVGSKYIDTQKALKYFTLAAQRGHTLSQFKLGQMYLHGISVGQSCENALAHFKAVTEKSDEVVRLLMKARNMYAIDRPEQALQMYMIAAELGSEVAQNNAAFLLDRGIENVFSKDYIQNTNLVGENEELQTNEENNGFLSSIVNFIMNIDSKLEEILLSLIEPLGFQSLLQSFHQFKDLGLDVIVTKKVLPLGKVDALRFLFLAAEQGNTAARIKIGDYFYYDVVDGSKNLGNVLPEQLQNTLEQNDETKYEIAAHHYKKASETKNGQALFNLGYMHQTGQGLPQDFHLAKRFYDDAKLRDADAMFPVSIALIGLFFHRFYHFIVFGGQVNSLPGGFRSTLQNLRYLYLYFYGEVEEIEEVARPIINLEETKTSYGISSLDDDIVLILFLFGVLLAVNIFRQRRVNHPIGNDYIPVVD